MNLQSIIQENTHSRISEEKYFAQDFTSLVRGLRGAYPLSVKRVMEKSDKNLLEKLLREEPKINNLRFASEDNPVLCTWHFSEATLEWLCKSYDFSNKKIALLGTPKLFDKLQQNKAYKSLHLFSAEKDFEFSTKDSKFSKIDIWEYNFSKYKNSFDYVFFDPPWYLNEYLIWLDQAFQIVKQGGKVIFSLMPELTKPKALQERSIIIDFAQQKGAEVKLLTEMAEYKVPSFEKAQLFAEGLPSRPWKLADFVELDVGNNPNRSLNFKYKPSPRIKNWEEKSLGHLRTFSSNKNHPLINKEVKTYNSKSSLLLQPSARGSFRENCNFLTSRGHGLILKNPKKFQKLIDLSINEFKKNGKLTNLYFKNLEKSYDRNLISIFKNILSDSNLIS